MSDINSSDFLLTTVMDLDEVKEAVRRWRHDLNELTFERQHHREELERLRLHERLFEDNEKLLRQENASLKTQLSNHCLVVERLKKLRVQYDALKEDVDDARATMCANGLEFDVKMAEKQRELERRVRLNADELFASQAEANKKLEAQRLSHREEMNELIKELEAQRAKVKTMGQQHRCEYIALQLERDEQLMQMEGRLRKAQSSGHDVCRQKYAALHRELLELRSRAVDNDDDEVVESSLEEQQASQPKSAPMVPRNNTEGVLGDTGGELCRPATPARPSKDTAQHNGGVSASPQPETRQSSTLQVGPQAGKPGRLDGLDTTKLQRSPAPTAAKEKPKRRKLFLEVEDVLFVETE